MTVGELFKRQSFEKDAKKVFRFTDCYGITWKLLSHPDSIRSDPVVNNFCELTSDFPCEVCENGEVSDYYQVYNQQLVFNLDLTDLKNIPSNVISTFDEIYTEPAKKSSGENAIVCQHLQVYKNTKPDVWFKQIVYLEDANGQYGKFEFVTDSMTSYDVAVNGSFSHLFVEKVERLQFIDRRVRWNYFDPVPDNNSIIVTFKTSANDRFNKKDRERKSDLESNTKCEHVKPEVKCQIQGKHVQDKEKPKRSALNFDNIITTICVILFLCAVGSIVLAIALWNVTFALVGATCSLTFASMVS